MIKFRRRPPTASTAKIITRLTGINSIRSPFGKFSTRGAVIKSSPRVISNSTPENRKTPNLDLRAAGPGEVGVWWLELISQVGASCWSMTHLGSESIRQTADQVQGSARWRQRRTALKRL